MDTTGPDQALLEEIESRAAHLALEAGHILLDLLGKPLDVQFKGKQKRDPVTNADKTADQYLRTAISEKFPEHTILSEEGGGTGGENSPFIWVLDPLDGTANFMNGLPLFAVSIGVLWHDQPVAGGIYVTLGHTGREGVYHARRGGGAYFNDDKFTFTPTAHTGHPVASMPGGWFRLSGKNLKQPHEPRGIGCIALELAWAACGIFRFAFFGGPRIWDVAGGVVIAGEAGCQTLEKRQGRGNWQLLETFRTGKDPNQPELDELRGWRRPVIIGPPETARQVAMDIRRRRSLRMWWGRMRHRRGRENRPEQPPSESKSNSEETPRVS